MGKTVAVVIIAVAAMFSIPVAIAVYQDPGASAALLNNLTNNSPIATTDNELDMAVIATEIHSIVNDERQSRGLRTVEYDRTLERASTQFAQIMIDEGFFDHKAPDGTTVNSLASDMGFRCFQAPYRAVADNLAQGGAYYGQYNESAIASQTVALWMGSEGHRTNILTPSHDSVGVGIAFDDDVAFLVLSFC